MTRIAGTGSSNRIFQGQRKDFIVMRKDTFSYTGTYTYTDDDNTEIVYDFTGCVGMMAIKKKKKDVNAVRYVSVTFDEEDYTLSVDAEDMDMDAGKYYYDLQIYDADSEMVTKLYGDFIVLQDITDFEGTIEVEYLDRFKSEITTEVMPKEKITVILSNTIVNELFAFAKNDYSVIFNNEIGITRSMSIIFNTSFGTLISITRALNIENNVIFGNTLEITTFNNYEDTTLFQSNITIAVISGGGI